MPPSSPVPPRHPSPGDGWSHRCGDAPSAPRPGGSPAPPAAPGRPPGVALPPPSPLPPLAAAPTSIPRPPAPRSVSPRPGSEPGAGAPPAAPAAAKAGHGAAPRGVMATHGGHLLPRDPGEKGPRTPQFPESAASYSSAASQERADALRHPESEMATSWASHFHQHGATLSHPPPAPHPLEGLLQPRITPSQLSLQTTHPTAALLPRLTWSSAVRSPAPGTSEEESFPAPHHGNDGRLSVDSP